MINGSLLLLIIGTYAAYKLACWLHARAEADR